MKKRTYIIPFLFILCFLLTGSTKQVTLFIIGDSTAAEKDHPETNPERGWGMVLQGFFDKNVRVENHAVNGRSSKSFILEGRWQKVLERIKPGDYVIIQFGHNDEKSGERRHTDPGSTFDANLERYVNETRAHGGIPVLMSCVVRRNFFKQPNDSTDDESLRLTSYAGEKVNSDTLVDTHGAYKDVPAKVARELDVYYVDANKITHDLEQGLGVEGSRKLHMWFKPGEVPSIPKGRQDNTHYNVNGARIVAGLLADALGEEIPALRNHIVHYDYVVSKHGRGNFFTLQEAVDAVPNGEKEIIYVVDGQWKRPKWNHKVKKIKLRCFSDAVIE
ncbi:MAG: GDSL-type esterase/lipase family protein [Prevotella sp.]|jgi:lysophospholipase L1-like esterase